MPTDRTTRPSLWRQFGWFALIWAASVAALAAVAGILRLLMNFAGLHA